MCDDRQLDMESTSLKAVVMPRNDFTFTLGLNIYLDIDDERNLCVE